MILNCSIKRDYLGIPYLVVSANDALNKSAILVNSQILGPSPDFCYAFCLRPIKKANFLMQATELKAVEACFDQRAAFASELLPFDIKAQFLNLESFVVDSERVFDLVAFILRLLPSGPETRAMFSANGLFSNWCDWVARCFKPFTLTKENAADYAFYATLLPRSYLSCIVNLVSRNENEEIERVVESLLLGSHTTNNGVRMSKPIAKALIESLSTIDSQSGFSLQRAAYYVRCISSLVFPFDAIDWFGSFEAVTVFPIEKQVSADVVFASARGVDLNGGEVTRYLDDMVSFWSEKAPSITVSINDTLVAFDKNLISKTGHIVWGSIWTPGVDYSALTDGLEGTFFYDGVTVHRLGPGMTGYDLSANRWVTNSATS